MKLKRFNPENSSMFRSGLPTISFNAKSGCISISKEAAEAIKIKPYTKIEVLQSEDEDSEWFVCKSKNGFPIRVAKNGGGIMFNSTPICKKFLESMEASEDVKSMKFRLATSPVKEMAEELYAIITLDRKK